MPAGMHWLGSWGGGAAEGRSLRLDGIHLPCRVTIATLCLAQVGNPVVGVESTYVGCSGTTDANGI